MEKKILNITFICTGNACRSPLAECILRQKLAEAGIDDIDVFSMGTYDWGSNPRDSKMVQIASEHGYAMTGNTKFIDESALLKADLIIVMAYSHYCEMTKILPYAQWNKVHYFKKYCFGEDGAVSDPNGGTDSLYRSVFDTIEAGCTKIVEKINIKT